MSYSIEVVNKQIEEELIFSQPAKNILFHVYRADNYGNTDNEGKLVPIALATLLLFQTQRFNEPEHSNIVFGADLKVAFNNIPLYLTYANAFYQSAQHVELPYKRYRILTPNMFEQYPVGTKTELEMFQNYLSLFKQESTPLIFGREPHMDRIMFLANCIGLKANFLSAESVFRVLDKGCEIEKLFKNTRNFHSAEFRKQIFMMFFDQEGNFTEWISKVAPNLKNHLLDLFGNRRY